jgi:signal transduction histidine kinase
VDVSAGDARGGVRRLAEVLLGDVERIAERSVARMQELLPSYARVARAELVPVTLANTRNLLEAIRDPDQDRGSELEAYRVSGDTRALQGITSDEMLQAWRIGVEGVREAAHDVAEELQLGDGVLLEFVEASLRWGDAGMRASASAHHEAEIRELGRLAREQAALRRVAMMVARESSAEEVLAKVAEEVGRLLGAEGAGIQRYGPDGDATVIASWGKAGEMFPVGIRVNPDRDSVTASVHRTQRPARVEDYEQLSGSLEVDARKVGMRSAVGSPIFVAGRLWGAILAGTSGVEPMRAEDESRIAQFTELVATAIANIQARAEVERLVQEQAALRRVATMVARERPPDEVFAQVAEEVGLLLAGDAALILRYEPDGHTTVVGNWGNLGNAFRVGSRWRLDGSSVTALVYRTQRPARFDAYQDAAGPIADAARKGGIRSALGSPIVVDGRLWGAIVTATSRAVRAGADAESRIAEFTELVATAISNVQARSDLAASRARIVAAADEERRQVVRDLHDGAQQRLVHTVVTLKLARRVLDEDRQQAAALVEEALQHAESATEEVRELAHGILPSVLTDGGLGAGVRALASRMSIPVEINIAVDRLPHAVEATAYFIVAEALTNVAKHSRAQRATVTANLKRRILAVQVGDDGIGGARVDGTGLVGLRDRLAVLDGTLQVQSPADGGTLIAASIPVR